MANNNNFDSNITQKLIRKFMPKFESARVLSKNINTQLLSNEFNPSTGDEINFKRPTDYRTVRSSDGDLTDPATSPSDIITGKAKGVVQQYFSVEVEFKQVDQALRMDQLDQLLDPMATRIVTDLELDFAAFMLKNTGLSSGDKDTPLSDTQGWQSIARWGATLTAAGIPTDAPWCATVNPYSQVVLSQIQRSLGSGGTSGGMISDAMRNATIVENYAGLKVMSATTLASVSDTLTNRAGLINGTPDSTYLGAKDTMQQTLVLDGLGTGIIAAGTQLVIESSGGAKTNQLNMSTRKPVLDDEGNNVPWVGTVLADVTIDTNAATVVVSGPAINEGTTGQYNTTTRALADNDVVAFLGTNSTTYQPNLFWNKNAFAIGSVPLDRLYSTDTFAKTEDGIEIRVSKGSDFRKNLQMVRFDMLPAYACLNPFFAGQGFGNS